MAHASRVSHVVALYGHETRKTQERRIRRIGHNRWRKVNVDEDDS